MKIPALAFATLALASCAQAQPAAPDAAPAKPQPDKAQAPVFVPLLKREHPRLTPLAGAPQAEPALPAVKPLGDW